MEELKGRFNNPWTLVGDFNDILIPSEQGGEVFLQLRATMFKECLGVYDLVDLEFFRTKFTWKKWCTRGILVTKRLDRE